MPDSAVIRILDAALNRAGEGLRVVEDYVRFVLDDAHLTGLVKQLRHDLAAAAAQLPTADRHAARDTLADVGTAIATASEAARADAWDVCAASFERTKQSLRSLEEFSKTAAPKIATAVEALRYRLYTLEAAVGRTVDARERLADVRLYVLIDGGKSETAFARLVAELTTAGVDAIQLRDKRLSDRELMLRARAVQNLCCEAGPNVTPSGSLPSVGTGATSTGDPKSPERSRFSSRSAGEGGRSAKGLPVQVQSPLPNPHHQGEGTGGKQDTSRRPGIRPLFIINDRPDVAAAADADGVHLGQDDMCVKDARAILGPRKLIGVSTHSIDQARAAVLAGANYLGVGPTFPTPTKEFDAFPGLALLRQVAAEIRLPAFAIGGIALDNAAEVLAAGFTRLAVSSAIVGADAPADAVRQFKARLTSS